VLLFLIGLVPLLIGPLLVQLLAFHRRFVPAMDGFVFVSVGGMMLLHILRGAADFDRAGVPMLVRDVGQQKAVC
jgi:hypothetical protein